MTTKGELMKKPLYNGMTFHRIVKKVAIQARNGYFVGTAGAKGKQVPVLRHCRKR